ncbi:MAG: esterase/lipase family protein [Alcaligenes sp.]
MSQVRNDTIGQPRELIPASQLTFRGLRSIYRRDGFGAEMVVVNESDDVKPNHFQATYSEPPFQAVTGIITFPGNTLSQILQTREATIIGYDPYQQTTVQLNDVQVPLAANFTSAYGLWLARSDFSTQALRTVLGRDGGIEAPHVFLLQPYDPNRRVIIMLHGLASSPEAWINVANEVLGDEELRKRYQIWQVYYPTNLPLPYNNAEIRKALTATFRHFDPNRQAIASNNIVVIGHSMGGGVGTFAGVLVGQSAGRCRPGPLSNERRQHCQNESRVW